MEMGKKKGYFEFSTGALVVIAAFVGMLVFASIVKACPLSDEVATWVSLLGSQAVIIATCLVASKVCGVSFFSFTGVKRKPRIYLVPFLFLIAATCYAAFGPIAGMISHMISRLGHKVPANLYAIPFENPTFFVLAFLALSVIPPIGEEMLFRGVLLSGPKRKYPLFAILYSALVFALFHGNPHQLVYQFFLGMIAAYLAVTTGGILAGVLVHGFSNALTLLMSYFSHHEMMDKKFSNYFDGDAFYISWEILVGVFASMILLVGLIYIFTYILKREREKEEEFDPLALGVWKEANAFLLYLAFPAKERAEIEKEKEESGAARKDPFAETYRILLPVLLVVIFLLVVILDVVVGDA